MRIDVIERLIEEWCDLDHNIICAAVNQWRTRLRACMRADRGQTLLLQELVVDVAVAMSFPFPPCRYDLSTSLRRRQSEVHWSQDSLHCS